MSKIKVVAYGMKGKKLEIDLCDTEEQLRRMTVKQLKEKIAERFPEHADELNTIRLIFIDKLLDEDSTLLSEYGIQHMSNIHMVVRVPGGGGPEGFIPKPGDGGMGDKEGRNLNGSNEDSSLLSVYEIQHKSKFHMVLKVAGGGGPEDFIPPTGDGGMGDKEGRNLNELGKLTAGLRFRGNVGDKLFLKQKFLVKALWGNTHEVNFNPWMTVENLKVLIERKEGIPPVDQKLIFKGQILRDGRLLSDYGIRHMVTVHLARVLRGGGPAQEEKGKGGASSRTDDDEDGGMGDKEGRNISMENLSDFNAPPESKCAIQ